MIWHLFDIHTQRTVLRLLGLAFFFGWSFCTIISGCTPDKCSVNKPTLDTLHGAYGEGVINFEVDTTLHFNVAGKYKPSDQFLNDSLSQGAGGYLKDTTLNRNKIQALVTGYFQKQDSAYFTQYHLVIGVCDTSASLHTGIYSFVKNNQHAVGRNAYAHFLWTDSTHFFETFIPKSGRFILSSFNQSDGHLQGSFWGTFWSDIDTSVTINISSGQFNVYLVKTFFNY